MFLYRFAVKETYNPAISGLEDSIASKIPVESLREAFMDFLVDHPLSPDEHGVPAKRLTAIRSLPRFKRPLQKHITSSTTQRCSQSCIPASLTSPYLVIDCSRLHLLTKIHRDASAIHLEASPDDLDLTSAPSCRPRSTKRNTKSMSK